MKCDFDYHVIKYIYSLIHSLSSFKYKSRINILTPPPPKKIHDEE